MAQSVITVVRQMQVPLLALVLLGACVAKLVRALRVGSVAAVLDASALFPPRLRRSAAICLCVTELGLGAGLVATASLGGSRADAVRLSTALLFLVAMSALMELRDRRPDLGCGCFGDLSASPIGLRSIIRASFLAAAALASVGVPPIHLPPPGRGALIDLGVILAGLLVLASLSPEVDEVLVRLGYAEPCETRPSPPAQQVMASIRRSRAWRRHCGLVVSDAPADMWRELCWWYVVYPGRVRGEAADLVFAVAVKARRPSVRVATVRPVGPDPGGPGLPCPWT